MPAIREPAVGQAALTFPTGEPPAPQAIVLPAPGIVQQYPFDSYAVSATVHAKIVPAGTVPADTVPADTVPADALPTGSADAIAASASLFFRVPGWSDAGTAVSAPGSGTGEVVSTQVVRDGSTRSIAVLLLLLVIILASIAILVTGSATRGRMKLELSVASWMTGLLFALIPLRGFFPGSPPLGSWMDILPGPDGLTQATLGVESLGGHPPADLDELGRPDRGAAGVAAASRPPERNVRSAPQEVRCRSRSTSTRSTRRRCRCATRTRATATSTTAATSTRTTAPATCSSITGLGSYPNLGVIDAYATVRSGDQQYTVRMSDALGDDRMHQQVGPYRIEVIEPLQKLRLICDGDDHGVGLRPHVGGLVPRGRRGARTSGVSNGRIILDAQRFAQVGHVGRASCASAARTLAVDAATGGSARATGRGASGRSGEAEPPGRAGDEPIEGFWWTVRPAALRRLRDHRDRCRRSPTATARHERRRAGLAEATAGPEQLGWPEIDIHYRVGHPHPDRRDAAAHARRTASPLTIEVETLGFVALNVGAGLRRRSRLEPRPVEGPRTGSRARSTT